MMGALKLSVLLLGVCTEAARFNSARARTPTGSKDVQYLFSDKSNAICGGGQIRDLLAEDPSIVKIRTMPWSTIIAIADNYIISQTSVVRRMKEEIARLADQIPKKRKLEEPADLPADKIRELITSMLTMEGGFGSAEIAVESKCGMARLPRGRRPPRGAYRATKKAWEDAIKPVFEGGEFRTTGMAIRAVCDEMLPGDAQDSGEDISNCDEICAHFADEAVGASDDAVGAKAGKSSEQLQVKMEELQASLQYEDSELSECKDAKTVLNGFWEQLEDLQAVIRTESDACQDAREALHDAQGDLDDLEGDIGQQQRVLSDAIVSATGTGIMVTSATAHLKQATASKNKLDESLRETKDALAKTTLLMKKAQATDVSIKTLKDALSTTMLKMSFYADEAIRVPVRAIGIPEKLDVENIFDGTGMSKGKSVIGGKVKQTVENLEGLCATSARPAFEDIKNVVNLLPLCEIGCVATIEKEIDGAILDRITKIKEALANIIQMQDINEFENRLGHEEIQRRIKAGEPQGLHEIRQVFGKTHFYEYLNRWELEEGDFLWMYSRLKDTISDIKDMIEDLTEDQKRFEGDLKDAVLEMNLAADSLAGAVKANEVSQGKLAEAQRTIQELRDEANQMESDLEGLQRALDDAIERMNSAVEDLERTHREGTNLLEYYGRMKNQGLAVGYNGKFRRVK